MEMVISPRMGVPRADGRGAGTAQADSHALPERTRPLATVRQELALHVHDQQLVCSACGAPWPCERAELAATLQLGCVPTRLVMIPLNGRIGAVSASFGVCDADTIERGSGTGLAGGRTGTVLAALRSGGRGDCREQGSSAGSASPDTGGNSRRLVSAELPGTGAARCGPLRLAACLADACGRARDVPGGPLAAGSRVTHAIKAGADRKAGGQRTGEISTSELRNAQP